MVSREILERYKMVGLRRVLRVALEEAGYVKSTAYQAFRVAVSISRQCGVSNASDGDASKVIEEYENSQKNKLNFL